MDHSLEELLAHMRAQGKEFGRRIREEQGKPKMPEAVCEGNTSMTEEAKAAGFLAWEISEMVRLGYYEPDPTDSGKARVTKRLSQMLAG